MVSTSSVWITVDLRNSHSDLDAEELDKVTQNLLRELRELDEVDRVERVSDSNPPEGNMSVGAFLVGILKTEVNFANLKALCSFLGNRFSSKGIDLEVEANANGNKITLTSVSPKDLDKVVQAAERLLAAAQDNHEDNKDNKAERLLAAAQDNHEDNKDA